MPEAQPLSNQDIEKGFESILTDIEEGQEEAGREPVKKARRKATAKAKPEPAIEPDEEALREPEKSAEEEAKPDDTAEADHDEEAEETPQDESEDEVEIPQDFDELAAALGREPEQLAGHIQVKVKVDGHVVTVPLSETLTSYQHSRSWTQKHQVLAEERRSHDTERQAFNQQKEQDIRFLAALGQQTWALINGEEETIAADLERDDPVEFWSRKNRVQVKREKANQLYQDAAALVNNGLRQAAQQHQTYLAENERRLLEAVPEWSADTTKAQREIADLRTWIRKEYDYSQEETDQLIDHRMILAIRELKQLKERKAAAPIAAKKVRALLPARKVTKPGATEDKRDRSSAEAQKLRNRLKKSGDYRDGANLLLKLGVV